MAGRRVLITGAGGFIGGHLAVRLVEAGARVRAMVRYNSRNDRGTLEWHPPDVVDEMEVVAGDLRDVESVTAAVRSCDWVLHLGAQIAIPYSYANPRDFFETNVLGTLNVAQAALAAGAERVVHASTSEVYGTPETVPITETHPLRAQSPYAASKIGADQLMEAWHRSHGLPVTVLRPFNTYGPHQSARAVIPTIVSQALSGDAIRLGALNTSRDFTFVDDTAQGFVAAACAGDAVGRTVQLGTGEAVTIAELVRLVAELTGVEAPVETDARRLRPDASEVQRLLSDPALAHELLQWRPAVSLREGLGRTIEWVASNRYRFDPGAYVV